MKNRTYNKKKIFFVFILCAHPAYSVIRIDLTWLMIFRRRRYTKRRQQQLHERERDIKAARGEIVDRNGNGPCNEPDSVHDFCNTQSADRLGKGNPELLTQALEMEEAQVRKKVEKVSSMERIASNVEKEMGDEIRNLGAGRGQGRLKILNDIILTMNWHQRFLDLQEGIIRESSAWK